MGSERIKDPEDPNHARVVAMVRQEIELLSVRREQARSRLELITVKLCEDALRRVKLVRSYKDWQSYIGVGRGR